MARQRSAPFQGEQAAGLTLYVSSSILMVEMSRKKISTTVYITPEQDAALKQLNAKTKVPVAEYIRQGIELVLEKYKEHLPGQQSLFDLK
jgi:hypothetical protein